jgi:TRAP-type mannitol/chloroaromatic compound transport system substrate-binding protein
MDRRSFIRSSAVGAAATLAGSKPALSRSQLQWKMQTSFPPSLDVLYGGAVTFATIVSEASNASIKIEVEAANKVVSF